MEDNGGKYVWNRDGMRWEKVYAIGRGPRDVYFRQPYFEPHLASEKNPTGVYVSSRSEKARLMRQNGVFESGDRVHGAR